MSELTASEIDAIPGARVKPSEIQPQPRVVSGTAFLALFTPAEVGAMIAADPRLLVGALKVAAQDAANLDSSELDGLLQLAVGAGVLSATRAAKIKAGVSP